MNPDISIIIVSYNVSQLLSVCLKSVIKASAGLQTEIIVVDNNSRDGSADMVRKGFSNVLLIENKANKGFAAACNTGIGASSGKFILLLNPDTVVGEDSLSKCIAFMQNNPDAGALGVKMINGYGKTLPESKRSYPTPVSAFWKLSGISRVFPRSPFFSKYYLGNLDENTTAKADILSGAFMFIRTEALKIAGLPDEEYFMYGEDIDLSYRLNKSGYSNYYFPEVTIIHYKGESTGKERPKYIFHFYWSMLIFMKKHGRGRIPVQLIFLSVPVFLLFALAVLKGLFLNIINRLPGINKAEKKTLDALIASGSKSDLQERIGSIAEKYGSGLKKGEYSEVRLDSRFCSFTELIELTQKLSHFCIPVRII